MKMTTKVKALGVACLAATAGLATTASLVLSAPASGVGGPCATASGAVSGGGASVLPNGSSSAPSGPCSDGTTSTTIERAEKCVIETGDPDCGAGGGVAIGNSVVSGDGTAVNGSVASGCSTAVNKSTASGGNCVPTRPKTVSSSSPAKAVAANPSFAG